MWQYTAITLPMVCPLAREIVRHFGSVGMSCHSLSH
jgi:hypothetical protein